MTISPGIKYNLHVQFVGYFCSSHYIFFNLAFQFITQDQVLFH